MMQTDSEHELNHPTHCFCQLPLNDLKHWAEKRYREHISTLDLLRSAPDQHDKEVISAVAMLDLDETTMLEMMGDVDMPDHHLVHCRQQVRDLLAID
jgi:hypothetical protein